MYVIHIHVGCCFGFKLLNQIIELVIAYQLQPQRIQLKVHLLSDFEFSLKEETFMGWIDIYTYLPHNFIYQWEIEHFMCFNVNIRVTAAKNWRSKIATITESNQKFQLLEEPLELYLPYMWYVSRENWLFSSTGNLSLCSYVLVQNGYNNNHIIT